MDRPLVELDPLLAPPPGEWVRLLFGTVDSTSPFEVIIDGDDNATPAASTTAAEVGDRVVLLLQSRVLVAIGVVI